MTLNPPVHDLASADRYLQELSTRGQFSGAVLLARGGQTLLSQGYGLCNIEQGTANTPQTRFQIASITKSFTALALLLLYEQRRLDLADALARHLPGCLSAWEPVTLHQLLTHTSGIPDLPFWPIGRDPAGPGPITPAYLEELFAARPLETAPGTRFCYSNWGYMLLGAVIEQVVDMPYAVFLQRYIFEPLGMHGSGYTDRRAVLPQRAASYDRVAGVLVNASFLDGEDSYAAGALYSTVEDLLRWDRALRDAQIASQIGLAALFTPHVAVGDGSSYGYGWQIAVRHGQRVIFHGGRIDGFRVLIERYPDDQRCVIVLSNLQSVAPEPIAALLAPFGC